MFVLQMAVLTCCVVNPLAFNSGYITLPSRLAAPQHLLWLISFQWWFPLTVKEV